MTRGGGAVLASLSQLCAKRTQELRSWVRIYRGLFKLFSRPGRSQGLLYKHRILSLKYLYSAVTPKRLKMVLPVIKPTILTFSSEILNLEGHQNRCIGSKVTAILLNGWILPNGGASLGRVCACSLRSRLVYNVPAWIISPVMI